MQIQQIPAHEAPRKTRNSKYSPLIDALRGGRSVAVPSSDVKLSSVRTAVHRAYGEGAYSVYERDGVVYVVATEPNDDLPTAQDKVGGEAVTDQAVSADFHEVEDDEVEDDGYAGSDDDDVVDPDEIAPAGF